ncbi:MAG TPA: ferrous iron transporter B [Candidatus Copromorpha excrementigallinarum]|uniref:Ferrous iron transporter B n=1 Tax=Candidatus Allocopromorpha excrementigallinarum TaxID=2840742 RepID=A0A9D1I153_9FIRM|nr:ferrous iron transporter B [Candidatus Copromorpha excrementigallinarum]
MALFIVLGIVFTMAVSKLLSKTLLKGISSSFVLELPPYRRPKVGSIIIRSLLDRTLFVLARAVCVAAPAGLIIWIMGNVRLGDVSLLSLSVDFFQPFGRLIGVDGVIVVAFILSFPANEILIPIMLMGYMATGVLTDYTSLSQLQGILQDAGWTSQTALSVMLLCLFHFPCATSCLTVKKETGSWKWTGLSILLPAASGTLICLIINMAVQLFHLIS